MKYKIGGSIVVCSILAWKAEVVLLFVAGGILPGTSHQIRPSMTLAIITASILMIPLVRSRHYIYRALRLYAQRLNRSFTQLRRQVRNVHI